MTDLFVKIFFMLPPFRGKGHLVDIFAKTLCSLRGNGWITSSPFIPNAPLILNLRDRVERHIWGGTYEPHVRRLLLDILPKGGVFLDVGAHIGYHTIIGALSVGPTGRVFAFEPDPVLYKRLTAHTSPFPWITCYQYALWEERRVLCFERSSIACESGWGTVTRVRDTGLGEHYCVNAISMDDLVQVEKIDRVDMIKIDTEGSEWAILKGAKESLTRLRPIILVELNDILLRQGKTSSVEVVRLLTRFNYQLFRCSWKQLKNLTMDNLTDFCEALCVPEEQLKPILRLLGEGGYKLCSS